MSLFDCDTQVVALRSFTYMVGFGQMFKVHRTDKCFLYLMRETSGGNQLVYVLKMVQVEDSVPPKWTREYYPYHACMRVEKEVSE